MITSDLADELMRRYVLWEDEPLENVQDLGDGSVGIETALRRFVVESQRDKWMIGREDWVADVVVATRLDLIFHGVPERFAIVVFDGGGDLYVNDPDAVAGLGARLPDRLDPLAFAELLVQFYPYSSATRAPLVYANELRDLFGLPDLPEVQPLKVDETPDGVELTFCSSIVYRIPVGGRLLDLAAWTVSLPRGERATWESHLICQRLPLELVSNDVA